MQCRLLYMMCKLHLVCETNTDQVSWLRVILDTLGNIPWTGEKVYWKLGKVQKRKLKRDDNNKENEQKVAMINGKKK